MAVCALLLSCDKVKPEEIHLSVEILPSPVVDAKADQVFVSVKSNSSWTAAVTDEAGESPVDWARLSAISGEGDKNLRLSYDGNPSEDQSRKVRVTVVSGDKTAFAVLEQRGSGVRPPEPEDPEVPSGTDFPKTGWMELPAMDDADLEYYTHSFKMGGQTYRNYSFGWSQKDRVSVWVAYPLSKLYTNGTVKREQAEVWVPDPLLGKLSSEPNGNYGSWYDRGHQLPFADRKCCLEAARQTFYGTNLTPQDPVLNQKGWANLENTVRVWSNTSDTTYVVTGCVVDPHKEYTTDAVGNKMTVPSAYFKAILRYSKSSTFGQWNAAAFYYKHEPYEGNVTKQHSMSIDELEEITGIDFFVNLPAVVGEEQAAKIEAADPAQSSVWW